MIKLKDKKHATVLQEMFIATKKQKGVKMSSELKRLMAGVPKEQLAVWKRLMLNAQYLENDFKHSAVIRAVKTHSGSMDMLVLKKDVQK